MSLEILLGPASKDHELALLERMQTVLANDEATQLFYIVPNHIKFESEISVLQRLAQLMQHQGNAVSIPRVQVFSLSRLAWYYMNEDPIYQAANVSKDALLMLVQYLLQKNQADLQLYGSMLNKAGFVSQFTDQLLELRQSGLSADDLTEIQNDLQAAQTLVYKLHDLTLIGEQLDAVLAERGQYLNSDLLLALKVYLNTDKPDLTHHQFFINRYSQMTHAERGVVEALITNAQAVTIGVPATDLQTNQTEPALDQHAQKLGLDLLDYAQQHDVTTTVTPVTTARPISQTLQSVEDFWYAYEQKGVQPQLDAPVDPNELQIWQASTPYQEVEQMARMIRQEVAAGHHRYRDYLLLARDLGPYQNMIPAVFNRFEIPFFMDSDTAMAEHPFVAFLDQLLSLADGITLAKVMGLLKTELLRPADVSLADYREALALTENYALAKNLPGWRWTDQTPWQFDRQTLDMNDEVVRERVANKDAQIELIHQQISQVVAPFLQQLQGITEAQTLATTLYQFLKAQRVDQQLIAWRDQAIEAGDLNLARQPEQVWRTFISVLDDFVEVFGTQTLSLTELRDVLQAGFDNANYTGIPATMDQVRISESGIVQNYAYDTTIIFGATSANLPGTSRTQAILNDQDRESLEPLLPQGTQLKVTAEQEMAQEPYLIYSAMMSAQRRLIWLYATSDGSDAQQASTYVNRLMTQFNLKPQTFLALPDPTAQDLTQFVGSPASTLAHVVMVNRIAQTGQLALSSAWQGLQQQVSRQIPAQAQRLMSSLHYVNQAQPLKLPIVQALFGTDLKASVSRLQSYARNPYEFFLQYGLRLHEREVMNLTPAEKGTYLHALFEQVFNQLIEQQQPLGALDDQTLRELVQQKAQTLLSSGDVTFDVFQSSARMRYLTQQLSDQVLQDLQQMRRGQPSRAKVQTQKTEVGFGLGPNALKPIKLDLPHGSITVRGKIDRYDRVQTDAKDYLMIVDYKSSQRKFDFPKVLSGLELQLMTYWMALSQSETTPIGGTNFFNAQTPLIKVTDFTLSQVPDFDTTVAQAEAEFNQGGRYTGVLRRESDLLHALEVPEGEKRLYGFEFKKDQTELKATGNETYSDDELATLLDYNRYITEQIGEHILQGQFPLLPYRDNLQTGLQNSDYQPVMLFDAMLGNQYRDITQLPSKRDAALNEMRRTLDEENDSKGGQA
ncbi:ATP-dependent helicase/nuclease subunit B [Weissella uvarum]|uniref:PD-(D/E)XK nuclease family protein n=1 Tax=Weissella uvarum TaxID=1479233 RepID=UPI00196123FF|nr:PD-(D/E)XK nuclease family protein [Weissella uvarum]MBM7617633.1 ATP-dependent helicase/nuclease subunit B [Weissella uvarum]MCM0595982.1 PD-(D/E)XK nuclease family protein [Weissella uvarum]